MKAKKVLSGALAAILLTLTPGVAVCAEEMAGQEQTENTQVLSAQEQENQEKAASYAEKIDTNEISNWPQGPAIYAASGIVMDMNSGAVLYAKKAEEKRYPASITKVLSVLTALQYAKMSDTVVFSEDSISFLQWDDAQIGMKPGEEISMESALYGMLLASANEVSYAVAENVGKQYLNGGYAEFIEEMNRISQELGCTSSNWVNANGLHDDNHYTTAHDMARIAAAAYQNEEFRRLETTLEYKVPPTNLTAEERILDQNHKMLWPENYYYYANAKAGKTGYTDQSKTTLVTMAEGNDMQLAAVVLQILTTGKKSVTITEKNLFKYLGKEKFTYQMANAADEIGIVRGLAWTSVGGDTLQIEVNVMPGKGEIMLTGQLGDVMKESARTGISYIRSVSRDYQIADDFFEKYDIHVHIPEGAVPKDGPSAGITMATAMLSAITEQKVRADIAMTGEVTLRGRVLPIGGLKEKLLAAKNAGIKTVLVPKKNLADVEELSQEITKGFEILPVEHMEEVLKAAFVSDDQDKISGGE